MPRKISETAIVILGWFVANSLGVAAVAAVPLILPFLTSIRGFLFSSLVIGTLIGFAQWIALRRVASISWLWILTIPVALPVSLGVINSGILGVLEDESVLSLTATYTFTGFLVGLTQWLLLRTQFSNSFVWVIASSVGLGLGFGLALASDLIDQYGFFTAILVILVYSTATGLVLSLLPSLNRESENRLQTAT